MGKQKYSYPTDRKEFGPKSNKKGGNRKPKIYRLCIACGTEFGPLENRHRRFCSKECWYSNVPKRVEGKHVYTKEAARVNRRLRYLISKGDVVRPNICSLCSADKFTEAAHIDYTHIFNFVWLCRSCHRKWDHSRPKNGTVRKPNSNQA